MDWDDLKILLALARRRSARGAAQELGVSNSTITRRLDDFERDLGTRLFDRTPEGYRMTQSAENLLPTAEHVEELVLAAERRVSGEDQELEGLIRLTLPTATGLSVLMPRLAQFAADYPGIELELITSALSLDLGRREADIAIRVFRRGASPPDNLIGRRISAMTAAPYVHRDLLDPDRPDDVSHLTWIGYGPDVPDQPWKTYCRNGHLPQRHVVGDVNFQVEAVRNGMGMIFAPCVLFRDEPEIVRVPGEECHHFLDIWVLTHKDLRLSARMRILREILAEELSKLRPRFDSFHRDGEGGS
ncbi:MAG: LysR family transcriptional regulator [Halieaceae bacterium]|jgi:DNA-binding transcriptional LysR family regulator|nr:LysR family transcriptional regulator [Halieaceae bacterium]